jgi:hypothetical protein
VTHDNQDAWKIDVTPGSATNFVPDPACSSDTRPTQKGALQFLVSPGDGHAQLRDTHYNRTYLRDLSQLDYWSCVRRNNAQQGPLLMLEVDNDGNNTIDDLLFFEPPYQSPGNGGLTCAHQMPQMNDTWQHWDALSGCWWWLSAGNAGTNSQQLSDYIAAHPDSAIVNEDGNHGGVILEMGDASPSDQFEGYVDAFRIAADKNPAAGNNTNRNAITYDYEPPS